MEPMIQIKKIKKRFHDSLFSTIEDFKAGNDQQGLEGFINTMDDLEGILEIDQYLETELLNKEEILPILKELHKRIKNQDVAGMTDLLEFTLYPIAKELIGND